MKIKASLLMPVLAALTIMAIVSTGIALGQLHNGAPWVTLLSSMPRAQAAVAADLVTVADSGLRGADLGQLQQPIARPASSIQPVQTGLSLAAPVRQPEAKANTPSPSVSDDSPEPGVKAGDSDLGTAADGPFAAESDPVIGAGDGDLLQGSVNGRSEDDPKVEGSATQLVAANFGQEAANFGQETESVSLGVEEHDAQTAQSAGDD
jgi:hypothetical protein